MPHRRAFAAMAMAALMSVGASGCGWDTSVAFSYRPPFSPIEIVVDNKGSIEFRLGTEIVTHIGTFGIGTKPESPQEGETLLILVHRDSSGKTVEERYRINSGDKLAACLNGAFYGTFETGLIYLSALRGESSIKIVERSALASSCPMEQVPQTSPPETIESLPRSDFEIVEVTLSGRQYEMALADTKAKRSTGMAGWTEDNLEGIDGMLYTLPVPQSFNPATGDGQFIFPGYNFDVDVLFFDAAKQLIAGGPVQTCPSNRRGCRPYYAEVYGYPVPYQYVLEVVRGRLPALPAGTALDW